MPWARVEDRRGKPRFERQDGAVVCYDHSTACNTARPWLPNHRGYMGFGPGTDQHNYLAQRSRRGLSWPKKFKTPEAAIAAVDKEWPDAKR